MEWDLARDVKNTKKEFSMYIAWKRKAENKGHGKREGRMEKTEMEKSEVLNEFFASVFTGSQAFQISQVSEPPGEGWGRQVHITGSEEWV